jgi:hypothetical protein
LQKQSEQVVLMLSTSFYIQLEPRSYMHSFDDTHNRRQSYQRQWQWHASRMLQENRLSILIEISVA